jgi:hypothetical protein
MKEEDFAKISALFDSKLKPIQDGIDAIMETTQATAVAIDKQIAVNEDIHSEQAATNGQLARHEGWIKNLADKANLKLEY